MATDDLGSTQSFGRWLKGRRQALDLTQKELAWVAGCSLSTLRKIEADLRRPSKQVADLLAGALHVAPEDHEVFMRLAREVVAVGSAHYLPSSAAPDPPATATEPSRIPRANGSLSGSASAQAIPSSYIQPSAPTNIPSFLATFIGREKLVERVVDLLVKVDVRLFTLIGPPGIGKTRLSVQVAARLRDHFSDGVYFVPLAPVSDAARVAPAIAQVFGVREAKDKPLVVSLGEFLRGKNMLLVLDNFEQVVDAASVVAGLMQASPRLKALVTSRVPLHVYGEHELTVPPMEVPSLKTKDERRRTKIQREADGTLDRERAVGEIEGYEAVRLFVKRSEAVRADFVLRADSAEVVAEICRRLDGLPLAIELAAVRSKYYDPRAILSRLQNRLDLLTGGPQDLPPRQQTLRAAIDWSYDLLDKEEQALFRQLGVFVGGFTLEAISDFGGSRRETAYTQSEIRNPISEIVGSLADKSLLTRKGVDEETRFGMLETIRDYAIEKLDAAGEGVEARRLHADYYLGLAESAEAHLRGPDQAAWLARLDTEHDNLRAALTWLTEVPGDSSTVLMGLRLGSALFAFWNARGYYTEGRQWMDKALGNSNSWSGGDENGLFKPLRAKALDLTGRLALAQGQPAEAHDLFTASLAHYRELADKSGVAQALGNLGVLATDIADYGAAHKLQEESFALARELGDRHLMARVLNNLGNINRNLSEFTLARRHYEENPTLFRELGDKSSLLSPLSNLGLVAMDQEDYSAARRYHEETLVLSRELGHKSNLAYALVFSGTRTVEEGDYAAAREIYAECLLLVRELGYPGLIAMSLSGLAVLCERLHKPLEAARLWGVAEAIREAINLPLPLPARPRYELHVAHARSEVKETAFEWAWAEGRAMPVEQACSYALSLL